MKRMWLLIILAACAAREQQPAAVSVGYRPEFEGYAGTELCYGCRLQCEAQFLNGKRLVRSESPSECSDWVMQRVPSHEHAWFSIGCWSYGNGVACFRSSWPLTVPPEQWLAYLQSLPEHRRNEAIAAATAGDKQPLRDCQTWAAQQAESTPR